VKKMKTQKCKANKIYKVIGRDLKKLMSN